MTRRPRAAARKPAQSGEPSPPSDVRQILDRLNRTGTRSTREGMARYGIVAPKAFGVTVATLRQFAKEIGRDHRLALSLWETGWYEARLLACFIADPALLTAREMDRWSRDFDNWAIVDTACLHLFDRSPHAWRKVDLWTGRKAEFVRRAGFALLAALALHDRAAPDSEYRRRLALIAQFAHDERNFVKKAVSWALHAIGRRSRPLNEAAARLARQLAASSDATERWVGRDALRKLTSAATQKQLTRYSASPPQSR